MNAEIKYRFAKDNAGKSVDILSVSDRESIVGKTFHCFGCNDRMIARLGKKRTHHFAHEANGVCNRETYLHKLGKKVFQEEYEKCLANRSPFSFEIKQSWYCNRFPGHSEKSCRTLPKLKRHALTDFFPRISVEEERDALRPDITLESVDGRKSVWIEIFVKHRCTEEKQKKNKIIEVEIQNEDDLQLIRQHLFSETDTRISFFGFKRALSGNMCAWPYHGCNLERKIFTLFEDKHWDLKWVLKEDPTVEQADGIVWWKDFLYDRHSLSKNEMEYRSELKSVLRVCASEALQDGFRIRACMFCAHFDSEANRCEKLREEVHLRRAINCPDYSETDWESSIDLEWY